MKTKTYPERIRAALQRSINKVAANLTVCVKTPEKDFSRKRKLPLKTMLLIFKKNIGILSFGQKSRISTWQNHLEKKAFR